MIIINDLISIKNAALINAIAKYSNVLFMLIANSILARILSPEDYGILAIITVFVTFFHMLSDIGFGASIIQNKKLTKADINNIFTFTFYLGIVLAILFVLLSFGIANFYNDNVYIPIGCLLAISIFFTTINMIPNSILMRDKKFLIIAIRTIVVYIISYSLTIVLAFIGWKYYSLIAQSISASIITFIWNYSSTRLRFNKSIDFSSIKKIIGYSSYNFGYDLINYFGRNLDNLLTGKIMGTSALGYYNKGYQLMLYPVNYLTNVITPVLHPILSDYQDDKVYIYETYKKIFKGLSLLGILITVYCVFASREIVLILYGDKWLEVIPVVTTLSVSIWFQMTTSSCTAIFKSLGESKVRFYSGLTYVSIQLVLIIVGVLSFDIIILARFVSLSFIVRFFIEYYFLINKAFGFDVKNFYKNLIPEVIIFTLLIIVMYFTKYLLIENIIILALLKFSICLSGFVIGIIIMNQQTYIGILIPKNFKKKIYNFKIKFCFK